jgi:hypothetical protein
LQMAKQVVDGLVLVIAVPHVGDDFVQNGARGGNVANGLVDLVEPIEHDAVRQRAAVERGEAGR